MKASDIRDLSIEEIDAKENELVAELLNLRFQKETGQMSSPARIREVRKDIARVNTIRKEKVKGLR
ncbi:MAG: 50S ribosomal protein L29 [bacterium]